MNKQRCLFSVIISLLLCLANGYQKQLIARTLPEVQEVKLKSLNEVIESRINVLQAILKDPTIKENFEKDLLRVTDEESLREKSLREKSLRNKESIEARLRMVFTEKANKTLNTWYISEIEKRFAISGIYKELNIDTAIYEKQLLELFTKEGIKQEDQEKEYDKIYVNFCEMMKNQVSKLEQICIRKINERYAAK